MSRNNNQNNYYGNNYNQNQGNYYNGNNRQYNGYNNQNGQYNNQNYNQNGQYNNRGNQNRQYNGYNNQYNNGQYNNGQYGYNGYNNQNKKKKKEIDKELLKKIGIGVGIVVLVLCLFFIVRSCSKNNNEDVIVDSEQMRIGDATYGYVTIPNDWLKLGDPNADSGIRYADKDLAYAVSLDVSASLNAQEFVYAARNQLQSAGVSGLDIIDVEFNDYNAYKLTGYYQSENKYVLAYFFVAEDNVTHYVGIEGPDNQSDYFKIPDTFKLTK